MKVKDFISVVFLNDYRKLIYDHGLHYISFPLIALGIEFLGACLDQHDFSERNLSGPRFRKAIKELFPPQYHPFSGNPRCPYYLHNNLRNTFAHQFRPGPRLGLTHRDESIKEGTRHLQIHNGRLTLVSEELYEDFENACKEIIRRIDNNSIGHPKVYDDYLLILQ